ncbi:MAG: thermostable hemolysin [Pseudomonadales bacterium]
MGTRSAEQQFAADNEQPSYALTTAETGTPLYNAACELAKQQYQRHFQCDLNEFYPQFFCLTQDDELVACCGYRSATEPLFLEQYLDANIETVLASKQCGLIRRDKIVEIGCFAVNHKRHALPFMLQLAPAFAALGFEHATCTVTSAVRCCLRKLGVRATYLGHADVTRLTDNSSDWGSYYTQKPAVLAGAISPAITRMSQLACLFQPGH